MLEALDELMVLIGPLLPLIGLLSLRVGVAFAAMPSPFGDGAPVRVRAALGVLVAFSLALPRVEMAAEMSMEPAWLLPAALGEVLVGGVIGLTVRVTLAAVEAAGAFAGFSSGLAFAASVDPTLGESSSPLGRALSALAVLIFFAVGGHHAVLAALDFSFTHAPPGNAFGAVVHDGILTIGSEIAAQGLRIAAPVVATMFLVQLGLALVSRAAPRVHLFSLSFAVAVSAGVLTLFAAAPSIAPAIAEELQHLPEELRRMLGATP